MTDTSTSPTALVTGAGQGIGWAIAQDLRAHGWTVLLADVNAAAVNDRAAGDPALIATTMDVTDPLSVNAAFELLMSRCGHIDLLVNNAGIQRHGPIETFDWDDWSAVIEVNLFGTLRCIQAAGRHMLDAKSGSIVNIASAAAERGAPGRCAYAAAKAGVIALTRTAAVEWASRGIRVNAVGPGFVNTEFVASFISAGRLDLGPMLDRTPMHRLAEPEEIARVVRFLGSSESSYVTGQVLYVDGGFLADFGVGSSSVPTSTIRTRTTSA